VVAANLDRVGARRQPWNELAAPVFSRQGSAKNINSLAGGCRSRLHVTRDAPTAAIGNALKEFGHDDTRMSTGKAWCRSP